MKINYIYEDNQDRVLAINKEGVCNYLKKKEYLDCRFEVADRQEEIKDLILHNKDKRIFWKLVVFHKCSDDSSSSHTAWFLERKEIKDYLMKIITNDFWFNGVEITKYKLVNKLR